MKAPDKIYINNYNGNDTWGNQWHSKPSQSLSVVSNEYIRKDALLEWLKIAEECYSHHDTANVVDTIRCEGKKWALQDVINKIESL